MKGQTISDEKIDKDIIDAVKKLDQEWETSQREKHELRLKLKKSTAEDKKLRALASCRAHGGPLTSMDQLQSSFDTAIKQIKEKRKSKKPLSADEIRKTMTSVLKKEINYMKLHHFSQDLSYRQQQQSIPQLKTTLSKILEKHTEQFNSTSVSEDLVDFFSDKPEVEFDKEDGEEESSVPPSESQNDFVNEEVDNFTCEEEIEIIPPVPKPRTFASKNFNYEVSKPKYRSLPQETLKSRAVNVKGKSKLLNSTIDNRPVKNAR